MLYIKPEFQIASQIKTIASWLKFIIAGVAYINCSVVCIYVTTNRS